MTIFDVSHHLNYLFLIIYVIFPRHDGFLEITINLILILDAQWSKAEFTKIGKTKRKLTFAEPEAESLAKKNKK